MKKIILTIAFIASGMVASAQVGVGTENPLVSLQVDRSTDNAQADGVLVPRTTVAQLNDKAAIYVAEQNGTLVFVTDFANADATGKTSNVTTTGFYYYNSVTSKWTAVGGGAQVAVPYQNIGGGVETLDGNSTISNSTYFVIFLGNTGGTLTTPTAVPGKTFWVKNTGQNAAVVAGQNIGGGKMRAFVCDGTNWYPQNQ